MKSIALFLILTFLISFSLGNSHSSSSNSHKSKTQSEKKKKHSAPCESKCMACQQTAYNIKFYNKANCKNSHCKSTCHKVHMLWNKPQSPFAAFRSDAIGKCEVCFRAGFCSMSECSVQKKFEISVINSTVDRAKLNGIVDDASLKAMLKKVMHDKVVNFKKVAKKVQQNLKKAKKHVNKKTEKKLIKTVSILNGAKVKKGKKGGKKHHKKNKIAASKLIKIIRSAIKRFQGYVSIAISCKKNKKLYAKKKHELKKQYASTKKSIESFVKSFTKSLSTLQHTEKAFEKKVSVLKNNDSLKVLLKTINRTINKIKNELKEAKDALGAIKKLFKSVK